MKPSLVSKAQKINYMTLIFAISSVCAFAQQAWIEVTTPDPSETRNMLRDIGGTSSADVWTVGSYETTTGIMKNLVLHWNGSDWQIFSGTDKSSTWNDLWGVTAITSNDVWAVGAENTAANTNSQLMHWNGSSWIHTNLPVNPGGSYLDGIDAIATNDIWAVGGQSGSPTRPSYTIHYNGSNWTEVSAPNVGTYRNAFYDVDGISSNDVWAVGHFGNSYGDFHAMAQHWDGSTWTNSALPANVTTPLGELYSVTMITTNDVWALGSTITGGLLMIHFDGSAWSEVPTAGSSGGAVVARNDDVFSVGYRISEWNGSNWTIIDSINQVEYPTLASAIAFPNGDVWAAGISGDPELLTFVYRTDPLQGPLAVSMSSYSVIKEGNAALMEWRTESETNTKEFVMERSQDGLTFIPVNRIAATGKAHNYMLIDESPLPGDNYYRLKLVDLDGSITLFPMKLLHFKNVKSFSVYPNPIFDGTINISLRDAGEYYLTLYDQMGQEIERWRISDDVTLMQLNITSGLTSGMYFLTMTRGDMVWSEKVIIP